MDALFKYSPIRQINFSVTTDDITVYPNPVVNEKIFIASSGNCNSAIIYDAAGKWVKTYPLQGRNNELSVDGIAKGIYQLKIVTVNSTQTKKIIIQ